MMTKEKVIVTGAGGFVGSNLTKTLVSLGYEVLAVGPIQQLITVTPIAEYMKEIRRKDLQNVKVIFHQAANTNTLDLDERSHFLVNYDESLDFFVKAFHEGCRRFVYASSTAVYGDSAAPYFEDGELTSKLNPLNAYGKSKRAFEASMKKFAKCADDLRVVGLRYCNVFGPGESHKGNMATMIYQLAQQMKNGKPKIFKWGEQRRDHIYVDDVVHANLLAAESEKSCILNCGSGYAPSFNEIVATINKIFLRNNIIKEPSEPIYINMQDKNTDPKNYQDYTECNMDLAKEVIGFIPQFNLEDGIEAYLKSGSLL